jgi:hypothetical protein
MNIRRTLVALQLFLALCALLGGAALVARPDGSLLHLDLAQLHSFTDYFIPGVVLLGLGMLNAVGAWLMAKERYLDTTVAAASGGTTVLWVAVQIIFMGPITVQQVFFGFIGFIVYSLATELVHEGHGPGWLPSEEKCAAHDW